MDGRRRRPWPALLAALHLLAASPAAAEGDAVIVDVYADAEDARAPSTFRSSFDARRLHLIGEELSSGLLDAPGTWVRRTGADGSAATVSLRGAGAQQVLVMLDGVPLNPTRGGGVDLSLLPAALVARVDVYRGGAGARFGSGALGGAVDVITVEPGEGALTASAGAGSFGTARASLGATGQLGGVGWLASVEGLSTEGDFDFVDGQGERHTRDNADARRGSGLVGLEAELGGYELKLTHLTSAVERGSPGPSEFQLRLSEARRTLVSGLTVLSGRRLALVATDDLVLDGALRLSHRIGLDAYDNPDRLLQSPARFESALLENDLSAQALLSLFTRAGHAGFLTAQVDGVRLDRERRDLSGELLEEDFARLGLFASASADLAFADGDLRVIPALGAERVADESRASAQVSPSIGVIAEALPGLAIKGNLGRAWRAPTLDELYLRTEFVQGDPDLAPERALSADLGVQLVRESASVELTAFRLDVDQLILFLPVSPSLYRAQNTGPVQSTGLEAAARWAPWRWLALLGGYTFTDARYARAPYDPLPGRPRHKGHAEVRVRAYGVEVWSRARGRSTLYLDNFGNLSNPPVLTVDAGAALYYEGWTLSLAARNIGDVQSAVDALQLPQPGRSLHAQLTWARRPDPAPGGGPLLLR